MGVVGYLPLALLLMTCVSGEGDWPLPLITFGLIADPHANIKHRQPWWCDHECWRHEVKLERSPKGRKHGAVLRKINESVSVLATVPGIAFSVNLGDLCDMDMLVNMPVVLDIWDRLPHPHHNLMGNHDLRAENDRFGEPVRSRNKSQAAWLLGAWGLKRFYYDFKYPPFRFVVLDSMSLPPTASDTAQRREQLEWLAKVLDDAERNDEDVIIFAHIPIGLATNRMKDVLLKHNNILAVFHGHKHKGGYEYHAATGKHMITIQGMIETNINAFAYVNVFLDRMELVGFGRVPSRVYYRSPDQLRRALRRRASVYQELALPRYHSPPYSPSELRGLRNGELPPTPAPLPPDRSQKPFTPRRDQTDPAALARYTCGAPTCPLPSVAAAKEAARKMLSEGRIVGLTPPPPEPVTGKPSPPRTEVVSSPLPTLPSTHLTTDPPSLDVSPIVLFLIVLASATLAFAVWFTLRCPRRRRLPP